MKKIFLNLQLGISLLVMPNLKSQEAIAAEDLLVEPDEINEDVADILVSDNKSESPDTDFSAAVIESPEVKAAAKNLDGITSDKKNTEEIKTATKNYKDKSAEFLKLRKADPKMKSLIEQLKQEKEKLSNIPEIKEAKEKLVKTTKEAYKKLGLDNIKQKQEELKKALNKAKEEFYQTFVKVNQDSDVKKAKEDLKNTIKKFNNNIKALVDQIKSASIELSKKVKLDEAKENLKKSFGEKGTKAWSNLKDKIEKAKKEMSK